MAIIPTTSLPVPQLDDVSVPSYTFSFKLEADNYALWSNQILAAIIGGNLEGFVTGEIQQPPKHVSKSSTGGNSSESTQVVTNPDYTRWRRIDQALLGWVLSSITKEVQVQISKPTTTFQLWNSLSKLFGSQSKAKTKKLKLQLQSTKKESMSMTAYFSKMKEIADNLAMAGSPISNEDFIMHLLQGIPHEYDTVVANINSHPTFLDLEEVQALLLNQELRIKNDTSAPHVADRNKPTDQSKGYGVLGTGPVRPHVADQNKQTDQSNRDGNPTKTRGTGPIRGRDRGRGRGRGRDGDRGRGKGIGIESGGRSNGPSGSGQLICQLCHRPGHPVSKCFYRYDPDYAGPPTNNSNSPAYYTSPEIVQKPEWPMDSGATNHHVIGDQSNKHNKSEYHRGKKLINGSGQGQGFKDPYFGGAP